MIRANLEEYKPEGVYHCEIVACDNTAVDIAEYGSYFDFINDPKNRFRTMTVPFEGGFELSVRI